jgi:hypothetical protein
MTTWLYANDSTLSPASVAMPLRSVILQFDSFKTVSWDMVVPKSRIDAILLLLRSRSTNAGSNSPNLPKLLSVVSTTARIVLTAPKLSVPANACSFSSEKFSSM